MNQALKRKLRKIAEERQTKTDPSHDFQHILRVLNMAEKIGMSVKADLDVVIPAALFHDTVVYKKDSQKSKNETDESAEAVELILNKIKEYPQQKIQDVKTCIRQCSFTKGIVPDLLESKVLQDADMLEATGAISIMRTFSSCGHMNRQFYEPTDPLCKKGAVPLRSGIDLFFRRLLIVEKRMHTKLGRKIARQRTVFLEKFLEQLEKELRASGII